MGGQRGRERYSVIGWPEPSLNAAAERAGDDENWEEGAGGGGSKEEEGEEEEEEITDVIYFDSAAECVEWYYLWAELSEMEKSLSERTARAVKQLRDNKAGFASKAAEAEEAVRYKAQGEALLQNRQVGNSQSIQSLPEAVWKRLQGMPRFRKQFASHWLQRHRFRKRLQAIESHAITSGSSLHATGRMPWLAEAIGSLPVAANRFQASAREIVAVTVCISDIVGLYYPYTRSALFL